MTAIVRRIRNSEQITSISHRLAGYDKLGAWPGASKQLVEFGDGVGLPAPREEGRGEWGDAV
jgi:hypothetical protein